MQNRTSRRRFLGACGAAAIAGTSGCVAIGFTRSAESTIEESYDGADIVTFSAATVNGDVTLRGEDREDLTVRATKSAASEDDLESVRLRADRNGGTLSVSVDRDEPPLRLGPEPRIALDVRAPADLPRAHVASTNGDLAVSDLRDVDAETTNGDIEIRDAVGDLGADTTNGDVTIRGAEGDVTVDTTNGDVDVRVASSPGATVSLDSTNGDVTVDGEDRGEAYSTVVGDGTRRIEITTTNGDVDVRFDG